MKKTAALVLMLVCLMLAQSALALEMTGLETEVIDRAWETNKFFARMEELTGVQVSAHGISEKEDYDKLLAKMEAGEVTVDVLFKANLSRGQEQALLSSGALIDLAPLIDEHMPNLSALLAQHPEWREIITLDDGRIASLPLLNEHERQVTVWINQAWLELLGVGTPANLLELTAALEKMKTGDPNQNGKDDEVAADLVGVYEMRWLLPYFGIVADDYHIARGEDGKLVFAPELPAYRAFIELLADWHNRGILGESAFTGMHSTAMLMEEEENARETSGMLVSVTPYTHVKIEDVTDYVPLLLAGPDGRIRWRDLLGEVWPGCFAVTSRCEDPAAALRWADALYAQDGALLAYAGVEGEDYTMKADGTWVFAGGSDYDVNALRSEVIIYTGTATPGLYPASFIHSVDSKVDHHVFDAAEQVRAVSEQVTLPFCLSEADQEKANALALELGELVDRGIARFATGEVELTDETYAAWLAELAQAGSGELTALFENAQNK